MSSAVRVGDITAAAVEAGIAGRVACVHASLRSFGTVEGGADAVVQGLLDAAVTVVVPTSSFRSCLAPRPDDAPSRPFNAEDDGRIPAAGSMPVAAYDPAAEFVDPAMGAIPAAVLRRPERVRGNHPLSSFSAIGRLATEIIRGQTPDRVYAPLEELVARRGVVVCMGVGLDAVTLLHLAELHAGLRLLVRWAWGADGRVIEAVHGGCSRGFEELADAVRQAETRLQVGASVWRIFDAATLLSTATQRFASDPAAGVCGDAACARCRDQLAYARSAAARR